MTDDREYRTRFSMAALDLASMFKPELGVLSLGPVKFRPELDAPSNVSTDGGRLALQHIRLVPGAQGFAPLIAGTVNGPQNFVEMRIFDYVDAAHRQRFGKSVPIDRATYDGFLASAREFFEALQMQVRLVSPPAELRVPVAPPDEARSPMPWILAALLAIAIGVGIVLALTHR